MHGACGAPGPTSLVVNLTAVFSQPLEYHARVEPACAGKTLIVCSPGSCLQSPGASVLGLDYASPEGGAVKLAPP